MQNGNDSSGKGRRQATFTHFMKRWWWGYGGRAWGWVSKGAGTTCWVMAPTPLLSIMGAITMENPFWPVSTSFAGWCYNKWMNKSLRCLTRRWTAHTGYRGLYLACEGQLLLLCVGCQPDGTTSLSNHICVNLFYFEWLVFVLSVGKTHLGNSAVYGYIPSITGRCWRKWQGSVWLQQQRCSTTEVRENKTARYQAAHYVCFQLYWKRQHHEISNQWYWVCDCHWCDWWKLFLSPGWLL